VQQNFGSGGSPSATVSTPAGAVTLTTSFARYSVTVAVPSISGKTIGSTGDTSYLELNLWTSAGATYATRASSIGVQNFTASIWGVQIEYGSLATPFQTASGGSPQAELEMCQRYFQRWAQPQFSRAGFIYADTITSAIFVDKLPTLLRTSPTITFTNMTANGNAITAASLASMSDRNNTVGLNLTTSGVVANVMYQLYTASGQTGVISYSSEL
jgi:hypothetical protein